MKSEKDLEARIHQDWTRYAEQARAARSEYIGQLLERAWSAAVRGSQISADACISWVFRKSRMSFTAGGPEPRVARHI